MNETKLGQTIFVPERSERHLLVLLEPGDDQMKHWAISTGEQTIGRSSNNAIVLSDQSISSIHAKILMTEHQVFIEDLGSKNGTYVNGVKTHTITLEGGEYIKIGNHLLRHIPQSFVFCPDDRPNSRSKRPFSSMSVLLTGIVCLVVVLMLLFYPRPGKNIQIDHQIKEIASESIQASYDTLLTQARSFMNDQDWYKATECLSEIPNTFSEDIQSLKRECAREHYSLQLFEKIENAVNAEQWELAENYWDEIYSNSIYKEKAEELIQKKREEYILGQLHIIETLLSQGQLDDSLERLQQLSEFDPDNERIETLQTEIAQKQKASVQRKPTPKQRRGSETTTSPDIYYHSAVAHYMKGDWTQSKQQFLRAQDLTKKNLGEGLIEPRRLLILWEAAHTSYSDGLNLLQKKEYNESLTRLKSFLEFNRLIDPLTKSQPISTIEPVLNYAIEEIQSCLRSKDNVKAARLIKLIYPVKSSDKRLHVALDRLEQIAKEDFLNAYGYEDTNPLKAAQLYAYVQEITLPGSEFHSKAEQRRKNLRL